MPAPATLFKIGLAVVMICLGAIYALMPILAGLLTRPHTRPPKHR